MNIDKTAERYDFLLGDQTDTPIELVDGISIISPDVSERLWSRYFNGRHGHLMTMTDADRHQYVIDEIIIQATKDFEEDPDNVTVELQQRCPIPHDQGIVVFRSNAYSAFTTWGMLCRNWWHFFMPTDDNNIVLIPGFPFRVLYIVGYFYVQTLAQPLTLVPDDEQVINQLKMTLAA
jgi:hypothetical protein